jgi:tetratricopeptide (TPR) repeat protein
MAQTWNTARIFISSTFRDMHAERDYLVRVVFPELRERCAKRRLHLVDVDLRWGVTEEEAEQGKVLEIILDEIDRSRPFFIAILGERYGFVPDEVPEDAESAHPWLPEYPGHSLTALEIIHGVLRKPDMARRSFFYFRDPQFIREVPESRRADFTAESPEAARKLAALKDEIRASGRPVLEDYPCRWDDVEERPVDLEVFGQRVLEDLWTAICAEYPEEAPEPDPLAIEREMHEAFAEERSRLHVGRAEEARQLTEYVQGTERRPVVITGESGCGKSAFLASWCRQYTVGHPDDFVLAYFIGASPDSANHFRLLRNMCEELKRRFDLEEEIPEDEKKLSDTLAMLLAAASRGEEPGAPLWGRLLRKPQREAGGRRIVIVVDALDQLLPLEAAHGLGWLLDYMPEKARLVVSSLEGDCLDVLRRREAEEIALPPLSVDEQRQIVQALLGEWRRKLDERQMAALLAHPAVEKPLYLRVALEELRLFGVFERLTARIEALAQDIPGLFDQVLARLEEDHGRGLVAEAFALLCSSRYGLSEAELLDLLRREGEEQLPPALWARLARGARVYLVRRGELFGFFHRQLADAVAARYLRRENRHAKLAAYFEQAPLERKLHEYPYQLQHADQWQALAATLSDLDFFKYAWEHDRKYEWMGYWRSLEGRFEPGACYQAAIEAREEAEGEAQTVAHFLDIIGWFLATMGLHRSALPLKERALTLYERILGPAHREVAFAINNLAVLYHMEGKYAEALPLYQRAVAMYEHVLGPNHPDLAKNLGNLGLLYSAQSRYPEALATLKRALTIFERSLGASHLDIAPPLVNLGGVYFDQNRHAKARSVWKRALALCESHLGPNNPEVAQILANLASLYGQQRKYAEALPLCQRALAIFERALGPDHPYTATSLNNLAVLYGRQRKDAEALPLYERALAIRERVLGPDHPDTAASLNNLAGLLGRQGKYGEALALHKRAVSIAEAVLGPEHPNTKEFRKILKACQDVLRSKR